MKYDFLIIGAGLFGAVCARELSDRGLKCLIIDRKDHIGGACYTKEIDGILVHIYGPHIFHTLKEYIWTYINRYDNFIPFELNVLNLSKGKLYHMPFNLTTMYELFDTYSINDIKKIIQTEKQNYINDHGEKINNLEDYAILSVGQTIYDTLIKGYTEKQWNCSCTELDPQVLKRIPIRMTFNNNYFNDYWQGIPEHGYTYIIEKLIKGSTLMLNTDYKSNKDKLNQLSKYIIYTGSIDEFYDYKFGVLDYRSIYFDIKENLEDNGICILNYSDKDIKYTRVTNHKYFDRYNYVENTILTYEYPLKYDGTNERYYPIYNYKNVSLYNEYANNAINEKTVFFGGRLAEYKYLDMTDIIDSALSLSYHICKNVLNII